MADEGILFGAAFVGVFAMTGVFEYARSKMGGVSKRKDKWADAATTFIFMLLLATGYVHKDFGGDDEPSILLTAGAGMQLFAMLLLWLAPHVFPEKGAPKPPAEFGILVAFALCARVWCTMRFEGYLPSDQTGDGCIQTLEALAMQVCVIGLARNGIQQQELLRACGGLSVALALGCVCYGSLDHRPWVDRIYATSQYAEAAAWVLMADTARKSEKRSCIYVLPSFVQTGCRGYFWLSAFPEIGTPNPAFLQYFFPHALLAAHLTMGIAILRVALFQDLRVMENDDTLSGCV